jgi:RimJ/RimL family protein N-acetyltransferase
LSEIRLEPFGDSHLGAVAAMLEDPDVQRHTLVPSPPPPDFPKQWLARYEEGRRQGTRDGFAIVDADGRFLGLALVVAIDLEGRTTELGYVVAPEARGRGVARRALELLTDWAFSELGVERIELRIAADNPASSRVAERAGYVREGVLRSVHFKQGIRTDQEIWSRLRSDS